MRRILLLIFLLLIIGCKGRCVKSEITANIEVTDNKVFTSRSLQDSLDVFLASYKDSCICTILLLVDHNGDSLIRFYGYDKIIWYSRPVVMTTGKKVYTPLGGMAKLVGANRIAMDSLTYMGLGSIVDTVGFSTELYDEKLFLQADYWDLGSWTLMRTYQLINNDQLVLLTDWRSRYP